MALKYERNNEMTDFICSHLIPVWGPFKLCVMGRAVSDSHRDVDKHGVPVPFCHYKNDKFCHFW